MKKEALALFMAAAFAAIGVVLPGEQAGILEELEPRETTDELDDKGANDPPSDDNARSLAVLESRASRYIVNFDQSSKWPVSVAPPFSISRTTAVATMRAVASEAHLSSETMAELEEISRELTENIFEEHEKEEALRAAIDALFHSLRSSRAAAGGRGPSLHE